MTFSQALSKEERVSLRRAQKEKQGRTGTRSKRTESKGEGGKKEVRGKKTKRTLSFLFKDEGRSAGGGGGD